MIVGVLSMYQHRPCDPPGSRGLNRSTLVLVGRSDSDGAKTVRPGLTMSHQREGYGKASGYGTSLIGRPEGSKPPPPLNGRARRTCAQYGLSPPRTRCIYSPIALKPQRNLPNGRPPQLCHTHEMHGLLCLKSADEGSLRPLSCPTVLVRSRAARELAPRPLLRSHERIRRCAASWRRWHRPCGRSHLRRRAPK